MSDQLFHFKNFSLRHENCAHKIGTDSMVLGALVQTNMAPYSILDIGSGSGVLAFMLAQKFYTSKITAIEPDEDSFSDLEYNVKQHKYSIQAYKQTLQNFRSESSFDLIVCNPPYYQTSYHNPDERKSSARHAGKTLSLEELFEFVQKYLTDRGMFWMIGPGKMTLPDHELYLHFYYSIKSENGIEVRKVLGFSKNRFHEKISESIVIRARGQYTEDYKELTRDFHGIKL